MNSYWIRNNKYGKFFKMDRPWDFLFAKVHEVVVGSGKGMEFIFFISGFEILRIEQELLTM